MTGARCTLPGWIIPLAWLTLLLAHSAAAAEPAALQPSSEPLPEGAVARLGTGRFRHGSNVLSVAFSPDGKTLASGGQEGLRIWDVATGKALRTWRGFSTAVWSVAFSPDGKTLAAAQLIIRDFASNEEIVLLEVTTGAERRIKGAPGGAGGPLQFSADGRILAGFDGNGDVVLWDPATGAPVAVLPGQKSNFIEQLGLSPDGKTLACTRRDGTIQLWDVARRKVRGVLKSADNSVGRVLFSADGKWLLSSGGRCDKEGDHWTRFRDGSVRVWDAATGELFRTLSDPTYSEWISSLALTPDGRTLAVSCNAGLALYDFASGKRLRSLPGGRTRYQQSYALNFSPDGKLLAGCFNSAVYLWETSSGRLLTPRPDEAASEIKCVALARGTHLLATLDDDGTVGLWDPAAGRFIRRLCDPQGPGYGRMALAPDGKTLAALLPDGTLDLWDVAGDRRRRSHPDKHSDEAQVSYLAFSPDGTRLASAHFLSRQGGAPRTIRIWDQAAGTVLQTLRIEPAVLNWFDVVVFSSDNRWLTATTVDGETYRWHLAAGKYVAEGIVGHTPGTRAVAYSPAGLLAVADPIQDGITLWDLRSGKQRLTLPGPNGFGRSLAFSPDGRNLASGAALLLGGTGKEVRDHTLRVYELASGQEVLRREPPPTVFVSSAVFAADTRTLVTGLSDSSIVVWDLFAVPGGPDSLPAAWEELANVDGRRAHLAAGSLVRAGDRAVDLLSGHLAPARQPEEARLAKLLADLDSEQFEVRKQANLELAALGELARPALERARADGPSAEVRRRIDDLLEVIDNPIPSAEALRRARAVAVLEQLGSRSARQLLRRLAEGAPESRLTQEAKRSLQRLADRPAS